MIRKIKDPLLLPKLSPGAGRRAFMALMAAGALILSVGLWRYDGPEGLWRRVHAEIAALLPRPVYVPTPLPVTVPEPAADPGTATQPLPAPPRVALATPAGRLTTTPARPPTLTLTPTATAEPTRPAPVTPHTTDSAARNTQYVVRDTQSAPRSTQHTTATLDWPVLPDPTPTATVTPPAALRLTGLAHYWQTWNNCGPAALAMHLSYFGLKIGQDAIGAALRPFKDDKNVSPEELAAYAEAQGLAAIARVNGDPERLRQLLIAGLPVLIETWYEPKPNDGMGHYRLIVGFDDATGEWIAYDSYDSRGVVKGQPYQGIRLSYREVDALWAVFNRAYVVIYDPSQTATVERILGDDLDDANMWARSLAAAEAAIAADARDRFAWFNLGSSLTALGRYHEAADAFDRARRIGLPWRMLWYQFAPFRAYYEAGRYDEVHALAEATLRTSGPVIEELFFWKGLARYAQGDREAAREAWQRAVDLNPNFSDPRAALEVVGP